MMMPSLDLPARAQLLGTTCRELVRLGQSDARIFAGASLAAPGSVARLRRWIAAGQPYADISRLQFCGSDEVRGVAVEVLSRVPAAVAWHAVEFVGWIEVGRRAVGWQGYGPETRTPDGDSWHLIALSGAHDDDRLRSVIAHELGHSWSRPIYASVGAERSMSTREWNARRIVAARVTGDTPERIVRQRLDFERLADDLASLWGYERQYTADDNTILSRYRDEQSAATDLADEIERALEGSTS